MNYMGETKEIYWHLPGFCYFRLLNQVLMNLMKDYPDSFHEGYRIGSVYGTFPGAIWNGGRAVFGLTSKSDMESILKIYNSRGIPVRFTWTNSLLEEKHYTDTYCNLIMEIADNGLNQVLVNNDAFEHYIRKNYPNYKIISSTTKRILDMNSLMSEINKDYELVVLDYDLNHNEEVLKTLQPYADKIEILVDEVCYPNCHYRCEHYAENARMQLEFDTHTTFQCPNKTQARVFGESMKRPSFISKEEIHTYINQGYRNFKLIGRGLPMEFVKDSYIYYLVKEDQKTFIQDKMNQIMTKLLKGAQQIRK